MKPAPPQPGWIERLYRAGVGLAIPLTIIIGLVLLLTARDHAPAPSAPVARSAVLMAVPLEQPHATVQLRAPDPPACRPDAVPSRDCPTAAAAPR